MFRGRTTLYWCKSPSGDGVNYIASGFAKIEYFLSDAEGTPVTWQIL
jgi:hypothetical protein